MLLSSPMAIGTDHPNHGPFSPVGQETWTSATFAPGAFVDGGSTTFAVYSKNASRVLLEIYNTAMTESARFDYWLERGSDNVWRGRLTGVPAGTYYGFRCWGPNWPFTSDWNRGSSAVGFVSDVDAKGNRFNPNKLVFDPYARELSHDRETPGMTDNYHHHAGMYGTGPDYYSGVENLLPAVVRREFDTGPWAPKSVLIDDRTSTGTKPNILQQDAMIYEVHVRGLTRHPSSTRLAFILS